MSATATAAVTTTTTYAIGDRVEDFELPNLDGEAIRLSDVAGRWTLLYFTTTWCPYCTAEAPYLESVLLTRFAARGLKLVVIDVKEPAAIARALPERFGWTSPFLVDASGEVSERFAPQKEGLAPEVAIINAHLLLDEQGIVRFAEYLNMERFDIRATTVATAIDALTGGEGNA